MSRNPEIEFIGGPMDGQISLAANTEYPDIDIIRGDIVHVYCWDPICWSRDIKRGLVNYIHTEVREHGNKEQEETA